MAITINTDGTEKQGVVDDNIVQPFRLEQSNIRGRMVRLGSVLEEMIVKHDYPPPVSALLQELTVLGLLLSAMLKYKGIFTLQISADGPISTLVADVTSEGHVRSWAGFDDTAVKKSAKRKGDQMNNFFHLLGKGHMAFTVDQEGSTERYQGIVELSGDSLADCVQHYFEQSEQIKTKVKLSTHPQDSQWRAGAIMVQQMPKEGGHIKKEISEEEEDWNRTTILLSTCTEDELLSPNLHSAEVLYRLFHEDGVRIYPEVLVKHQCRCSKDRVGLAVQALPASEIDDIFEQDGVLTITCKFCGHEYNLDKPEVDALL